MTLPGMTKPLKPIPVFKQMPGERKNQFYNRMNQTVQVILSIYVVKRIKVIYTFPFILKICHIDEYIF